MKHRDTDDTPSSESPREETRSLEPEVETRAAVGRLHRREVAGFLAGLATALPAGLAWPRLRRQLESPRACPSQPAAAATPPLAAGAGPAIVDARARLFLVVPADPAQGSALGRALGALLNHGDDGSLALLAAVDLACIGADELDHAAEIHREGEGEAGWLLLSDAAPRLVRFALPERDYQRRDQAAEAEQHLDACLEVLRMSLRRSVLADGRVPGLTPRMLARPRMMELAAELRRGRTIDDWQFRGVNLDGDAEPSSDALGSVVALAENPLERVHAAARQVTETTLEAAAATEDALQGYTWRLEELLEPDGPRRLMPAEVAHFGPALLHLALSCRGTPRAQLLNTLAESARIRLVQGKVTGAEWGNSAGCGSSYDDRPARGGIGCGMGHVSERGRRFLAFYSLES
ncbi:hypothetical protein [Haliangium ochraceum]|nr:hypothetical protein [Haliangium ochraceum]